MYMIEIGFKIYFLYTLPPTKKKEEGLEHMGLVLLYVVLFFQSMDDIAQKHVW